MSNAYIQAYYRGTVEHSVWRIDDSKYNSKYIHGNDGLNKQNCNENCASVEYTLIVGVFAIDANCKAYLLIYTELNLGKNPPQLLLDGNAHIQSVSLLWSYIYD